jgi:hypothetical protein
VSKSYYKIGQEAARTYMAKQNRPVSLWSLSCAVDHAVRAAGKKSDMYESLFDYEQLVPAGYHCTWLQNKRGGDKIYYVVSNGFTEAQSQDLLLGSGILVSVPGPD